MLHSLLNTFGFTLRNSLRWSRGTFTEINETKSNLFVERTNGKILNEREKILRQTYSLDYLYAHSTCERYIESLTYLEYVEQLLSSVTLHAHLSWLDVGVKNWSYVEGMYRYLENNTQQFSLTGIELDAFRMYRNFYNRADYAKTFTQNLNNTSFINGDVLQHFSTYDVVSCFLPFIFIEPALAWGLPEKFFQPKKIYQAPVFHCK